MTPLPEHLEDRWANRVDQQPGEGVVYWHLLLGEYAEVRDQAGLVRDRLAGFTGLHFTPDKWLHATTLVAGPRDRFTAAQLGEMTHAVRESLAGFGPVPVRLDRVLYHPQAIMLAVDPAAALEPIRAAVTHATDSAPDAARWVPHSTIAYSTADQPAAPVIAALGVHLPPCEVTIGSASLVVQWGPERDWDWEIVDTIPFGSE